MSTIITEKRCCACEQTKSINEFKCKWRKRFDRDKPERWFSSRCIPCEKVQAEERKAERETFAVGWSFPRQLVSDERLEQLYARVGWYGGQRVRAA